MIARLRSLPGSLFLLLFPLALAAQQGDVRLSPPEPTSYYLSQSYQIQSAARSGNNTLVVWGTSAYAADSTIVGELRMQLIRDTTVIGGQRVLTASVARPAGVV